ncbi:MAG TPA: BamA/TamA family outer membrane protein, partial [Chitinophagaceae bacterium]
MFKLGIDSRNNKPLPTRGFLMDMNVKHLFGLNNVSNNLTQFDIDMRVYASIFKLPRLVLASRLGFGVNYGDFEFPQAYKLGGTENLRGYRRDRFAGKSALYNNTEIRFRIADFNTYLFPGSIGIHLFNDVGRVWHKGESSKDWHVGNGGGIWIAPVRRVVVTASITRSKEEKALPLVTFGFQF